MKKLFLALLLISLTTFAQEPAKETYSFTLQQAIDFAVKNNYSVINANRDLEIAKEKKWETTTIGLPQINGQIGYQNNIQIQKSLIPAEIFGGPAGTFAEVAFGTKQNMGASATLSQLLFNGSYLVGLQSAKVYLQISENAKVKTNNEIKEIVINTYGNVLLADESIAILEKNKTVLSKTLSDTKQIYKNGLIEEENVEQLQITLSSLESAQQNVIRQKKIAVDMLKLLLGINLESNLTLTDKLDILTQQNMDLEVLKTEFDAKTNIDYQIGENLTKSKELLVKLEKSKALPTLAANLNFGYNSFGNDFTFFNSNQRWFNYSNVSVGLNVPIFSSFARSSRTQQAKIELDKSKTELTQTEQNLKLQFEKAKSDYGYSLEQLTTSKNNLSLAERIENKNQIKFKEGLSTSFNLAEAQRQLYTAQQSYLQAMLEIVNKKASLEKIINKN